VTFEQRIIWTRRDGTRKVYTATRRGSFETAQLAVFELARHDGWTYPRWWQYWRWFDTRPLPTRHDSLWNFMLEESFTPAAGSRAWGLAGSRVERECK
jgi:hypothetical protein